MKVFIFKFSSNPITRYYSNFYLILSLQIILYYFNWGLTFAPHVKFILNKAKGTRCRLYPVMICKIYISPIFANAVRS